jgi:hypothetical protein
MPKKTMRKTLSQQKSTHSHSTSFWKRFIQILCVLLLIALLFYFLKQPSHTRNWSAEFAELAQIHADPQDDSIVTLQNFRSYTGQTLHWSNITLNISEVTDIYFLVEPFDKWDAVAHTFLLIDFANQTVGFSVEARREVSEVYSAISGLFRNFEVIYIWGTQEDVLVRRANKYSVYMYPLNITYEQKQRLLRGLFEATNTLNQTPQFYNTITSTCTTHLASIAHQINTSAVPYNVAWNLPGKSDQFLYEQGLLAIASPPKVARQLFDVSPIILTTHNYSQHIRQIVTESARTIVPAVTITTNN